MQCRTCGYELWNLTQPVCPECGTSFDLRTYVFTPKTVAFACPHCGHEHEGTGWQCVPALTREMVCQGCGRSMQVMQMRVVPLVGEAKALPADLVPWEQRKEIGRWRAWWRTTTLAIGSPMRLAHMIQPSCSLRAAFRFAAIAYGLAFLIPFLLLVAVMLVLFTMSMQTANMGLYEFLALAGGLLVFLGITIGLGPLFMAVLPGVIAHGLLRIMARPAHPLRVTIISGLYAQGPIALGAIPFCVVLSACGALAHLGLYAWALGLSVYFTVQAQRVSRRASLIAWLALPMTMLLGWIGWVVWMIL